jgi:2-methylcitrate dehydratase PrpD
LSDGVAGTAPLAAERLAEHVVATRFEHLSAAAVAAAKTFILDSFGVGVAGSCAPFAAELRAAAQRWGAGADAGVWGGYGRLPAPSAALVNGFQIHNQEFDCVHEPAVVHALSVPQAAAVAFMERAGGVSGRDFLTALALGVDVAAGLGLASRAGLRFFRPATAGAFGAVAALARLAGFDADRLMDAWGIVYGQIGGTMQSHVEGKPLLPLQIGFAARAAVNAVDLAAAGLDGPRDVFEGKYGYLRLFEGDWDLAPVWRDLGRRWRIAELSHKPFPTGRATHGGLDGILQLRARHGFAAADVDTVRVIAPPLIHQLVGRPDRPDPPVNYARLCMAFVGALALTRGTVALEDFAAERLVDPALHALAARIAVVIDDNPDPNALNPQRVEIALTSGARHAIDLPVPLGNPAAPLDRARHLAKFHGCWRYAGLAQETGEALIALVDRLDSLPSTSALVGLLTP